MNLEQLKAKAYDTIAQMQYLEVELKKITEQIMELDKIRMAPVEKPVREEIPKEVVDNVK